MMLWTATHAGRKSPRSVPSNPAMNAYGWCVDDTGACGKLASVRRNGSAHMMQATGRRDYQMQDTHSDLFPSNDSVTIKQSMGQRETIP